MADKDVQKEVRQYEASYALPEKMGALSLSSVLVLLTSYNRSPFSIDESFGPKISLEGLYLPLISSTSMVNLSRTIYRYYIHRLAL